MTIFFQEMGMFARVWKTNLLYFKVLTQNNLQCFPEMFFSTYDFRGKFFCQLKVCFDCSDKCGPPNSMHSNVFIHKKTASKQPTRNNLLGAKSRIILIFDVFHYERSRVQGCGEIKAKKKPPKIPTFLVNID